MSTTKRTSREIREDLVEQMRHWQRIEDASVASTGRVIEQTDNPLIRLVMEIIQSDSQMHHRVQAFIANSLDREAIALTPDQLTEVWSSIEKHIEIERQMVRYVEEALDSIRGRKMIVQEYFLNYLHNDEKKHKTQTIPNARGQLPLSPILPPSIGPKIPPTP